MRAGQEAPPVSKVVVTAPAHELELARRLADQLYVLRMPQLAAQERAVLAAASHR